MQIRHMHPQIPALEHTFAALQESSTAEEVPSLNRPNTPPQALMAQSADGNEISASTSSDGEDVQGDMLKPTVANTPWVRHVDSWMAGTRAGSGGI